jgi:lipopolysaccharide biosynthesis glycosyltransferase
LSCIQAARPAAVTAHILCDTDVNDSDRERLADVIPPADAAQLVFLDLPTDKLTDLPDGVLAHGGAVSCARFFLPDLLPELNRLIYLDADTLCVSSIQPLWDLDLAGRPLAAVGNVTAPYMRERIVNLGLRDPLRYFNSGVLLMDLDLMRRRDDASDLMACIRSQGDGMLWVDQDALNLVFEDAWCALPPRWNAQNSLWFWSEWARDVFPDEDLHEARTDPAILHFEGPSLAKPWHYLCRHPYTAQYRRVLSQTAWPAAAPTEKSAFTALIRPLPRERQISALLWRDAMRERVGARLSAGARKAGG